MAYRTTPTGTLEVSHPETQSYVPAQVLLPATNGYEVKLNAVQQALLTQLADALIQDRATGGQAYLASVQTLINAIANNIDELEPVLKQVRDALNLGGGNTVYARMVESLAQLTTINALADSIRTYVDNLEMLSATSNDLIALINNTTLATVNSLLTAINASSSSLNTTLSALNAKVPATLGQKAMATSLAVALASDQSALSVRPPAPASDYTKIQASAGEAIKTSAGRLFSFACWNYSTSLRYLQLFDRTTAPAGAPLKVYPIYPANTNGPGGFFLDRNFLGTDGAAFATGICWGLSTTLATYTAAATTDCVFEAKYT